MKPNYFILALLSISIFSCDKDTDVLYPDPFHPDQEQFRSSLFVEVVSKSGQPIANTTIRIGNFKRKTDVRGFVYLKDVLVGASTYLVAENAGYFHASRRFYPTAGSAQYIKLILLPLTRDAIFSSKDGATIALAGNVKLHFPTDAYEYLDGQPYEGNVVIAAEVIPTDDPDLSFKMPGDLTGLDVNGDAGSLASMGMIAVEMQSLERNRLKLKEGAQVQMDMTLPASMQGFAPATIPMWYFNEDSGLWREEGAATLAGNVYTANVSHFSYWNYDAWFPAIKWGATFDFGNRGVASQMEVCITIISLNTTKCAYTNSEGMVCGLVAANELLLMEVKNECGDVIYSDQIGPFSDSTMLGPISISDPGLLITNVKGYTVTCEGEPVTDGYVTINIGYTTQYSPLDEISGAFNVSVNSCDEGEILLTAVDLEHQTHSLQKHFDYMPVLNVDTISVCETNQEFIDLEIVGIQEHYYFYFPTVEIDSIDEKSSSFYASDGFSQGSQIQFTIEGQSTGVFTVIPGSLALNIPGFGWFYGFEGLTVTVTHFGSKGEYITGTLKGTWVKEDPGSGSKEFPLVGSFSVLREE